MNHAIRAILFDLDGTLVESEQMHTDSWVQLLEQLGCALPSAGWADSLVGTPDSHTRDEILHLFPHLRDAGDILEMKQNIFRTKVAAHGANMAMPGLHERLRRFDAAGIPMAVGTNGVLANCRAVLAATGLLDYFKTLVTFDQVDNPKPAPDIYRTAADRLGLQPEECAVIEDSPTGVRSGVAAGCVVVAVETTMKADNLAALGPRVILPDTASALDWIGELIDATQTGDAP